MPYVALWGFVAFVCVMALVLSVVALVAYYRRSKVAVLLLDFQMMRDRIEKLRQGELGWKVMEPAQWFLSYLRNLRKEHQKQVPPSAAEMMWDFQAFSEDLEVTVQRMRLKLTERGASVAELNHLYHALCAARSVPYLFREAVLGHGPDTVFYVPRKLEAPEETFGPTPEQQEGEGAK